MVILSLVSKKVLQWIKSFVSREYLYNENKWHSNVHKVTMLIKQNKVFLLYPLHSVKKVPTASLHTNTDLQLLQPHGFSYMIKVEIILF